MNQIISAIQAESDYAFINSIGVNVHLSYYNTAYANETAVLNNLEYLGIDQVRDAAPITTDQDYWLPYEQDMAAGVKFDFVIPQNVMNIANIITDLNALETKSPDGILAVEGVNEWTSSASFDGLTGQAAVNAFQAQLDTAVHSDPLLAGVSVYSYTFNTYSPSVYTAFGNISDESNYGNEHLYYAYEPPQEVIPWLGSLELSATPNDPYVVTETGYDTMPGEDSDGSQGVNNDVQAKYTLDDVFDLLKGGASMAYIYELLDEKSDPGMTDHEFHFGLFNYDGTPKPAAVALHNLTTILVDNGANASTFEAGSLAYTLSGLSNSGNSMLLEKSDGSYYLSVWAEPEIWNPTTLTEIALPATSVTVTLGHVAKSVEVFDPLVGTTPIATYTNVTQFTIAVTDHPLILEIDPVTDPVLSGVPAAQSATAAIAQFATLDIIDPATSETATVTLSAVTDGTLRNFGIGTYSAKTGVYTVTGTPVQVQAALQALTFTPTGATATTFSLTVSNAAGTSELSTAVTDAAAPTKPILSGTPAAQAAAAVVTPFATLQLADGGTQEGASVFLGTASQGTLGNLGTGTYSVATGIYSVIGTPAQVLAALQGLTFMPTAGGAEAYTTNFTLTVSNAAGTSELLTAVTGGQPLPKPALSGVATTEAISSDGVIAPFAQLNVTDLTVNEGAGVIIGTPTQGTLGNPGRGTYSAVTGIYSVSGTPAQVLAALNGLTFKPTAGASIVTTTTLTISDSNSVGTSGISTRIATVNQSLLPIPHGETAAVAAWSGSSAAPTAVAGDFNEAVVAGASGVVTAPAGFQAVLLGGAGAAQLTDASQGGVVLAANQGTDTLTADKSGDTLIGGTGHDTYIVTGSDTVTAGCATSTITAEGGGNTLTLGTGGGTVISDGGDTIYAGLGAATITAGTGDTVHAGAGALTFIGGSGSSSVIDANGTILLSAPSSVIVSAGSVNASSGSVHQVTLTGGGDRNVTLGSGAETLNASAATGNNTLTVGNGNDIIDGGSGAAQFQFIDGHAGGTDIIAGFNLAIDKIVLSGYGPSAISAVLATAHTSGGSTTLVLSDNTHLTLSGVTGVTSAWFATALS